MGLRSPASRIPAKSLMVVQRAINELLPSMIPSITTSVVDASLTTTQLKPIGNHTLQLADSGKSICGGNGTIYVPTNQSVAFPVVTTINIVTENDEYVVQAVSNNTTSIFYNGNSTSGSWIIPPRTMVKLCKIDTDAWNLQGENLVRF